LEILKDLKLNDSLFNYLIHLFTTIDSSQKTYKIETSLTESKIISQYNIQLEYEKNKVVVDNTTYCFKCKRGFSNSPGLVFIQPKTYFHMDCYNNYIN
jgi:hypothetical protein